MTDSHLHIEYRINAPVAVDAFIDVLLRSGLADRRPVHDRACMTGMVRNGNLMISAWRDAELVGIARSITDYHYACYLSDLAVDAGLQDQGIGRRLQALTRQQLGPHCKLILLAAPAADSCYGHIGYSRHPACWVLDRDQSILD